MVEKRIDVEICVEASETSVVRQAAEAASSGGAARIELCADMENDGLTPADHLIHVASGRHRVLPTAHRFDTRD